MTFYQSTGISQIDSVYTESSSRIWRRLFNRQLKALEGRACQEFIDGIQQLKSLIQDIPNIEALSMDLYKLAGWKIYPVSGLVESKEYFNLLANKYFPVATFLRSSDNLDYSPLPDMWHDVFGHIPLLLSPVYRDFIEYISLKTITANEREKEKLSTIYWYTIEAGVCLENGEHRVYGASQLSSFEEIIYAVSDQPNVVPFTLKKVCNTLVNIHELQQTFFEIPSFNYLGAIKYELEELIK